MPPDYTEMLHHIGEVEKHLKKGIEAMQPMKKLTQTEAYILAYMRAAEAVVDKAKAATLQFKRLKEKASKPEKPAE